LAGLHVSWGCLSKLLKVYVCLVRVHHSFHHAL
jgi:hypothetical protein